MNFFYNFKLLLLVATTAVATVACNKPATESEKTEPNEEVTSAAFARVSVSDATPRGFSVTVDVDTYDGAYAIIPATQEEIDAFDSVEEYVEAYLLDDIAKYETDYSKADGSYVFKGDVTFDTSSAWNLGSGMEFFAIVVGTDGDGTYVEMTTEVVVSEGITILEGGADSAPTEIELSDVDFGSIDVYNASTSSFDFTIEPKDKSMRYVYFDFTSEEYNSLYKTDEERIAAVYYIYSYAANLSGVSFTDVIAAYSAVGEFSGALEDLEAGAKYYIVAFGIDPVTYQPATAVESASIVTLKPNRVAANDSRKSAPLRLKPAQKLLKR